MPAVERFQRRQFQEELTAHPLGFEPPGFDEINTGCGDGKEEADEARDEQRDMQDHDKIRFHDTLQAATASSAGAGTSMNSLNPSYSCSTRTLSPAGASE